MPQSGAMRQPTRTPTREVLLSGVNVKHNRKHAPPAPKCHVIDIGKLVSMELTAEKYGFAVKEGAE